MRRRRPLGPEPVDGGFPERLVRFVPSEWPPSRTPFLPGSTVERAARHAVGDHSTCDGPTDWYLARDEWEAAHPDVGLPHVGHSPDVAWDPDLI